MIEGRKTKILWFCSSLIKPEHEATGLSWVHTMAHHLINDPSIELYNICEGMVGKVTSHPSGSIKQWEFPAISTGSNGLPDQVVIDQVIEIVRKINPDLIHYWGTESFWPLLSVRGFLKTRALLEIQGLKYTCYPFFTMGMSKLDIVKAIGIREIIKPGSSITRQRKDFQSWGELEKEMIRHFDDISVQSEWVHNEIRVLNPNARIHRSRILLRAGFTSSSPWKLEDAEPHRVFTSATSSTIPYKGFHILVDAIYLIKKRYPDVKLAIAGFKRSGIRKTGYERWVDRKIKKLGLTENIEWLGQLSERDLVSELKKAHVSVVPSFVESYSLAMDESLTLGVPTVVSNTAAMPELADSGKNALLVEAGNTSEFAEAIMHIFESALVSRSLSKHAIGSRRAYHQSIDAGFQKEIYATVLGDDSDS